MRQYVVLLSLAASFLLLVPPNVAFASGFIENKVDWVQLRHEKATLKTTYFENKDTPKSVQDFTPDFIEHHFKPTPENHSFGFSKSRYWFYTEINIRNLAGSEHYERFEAFLEIAYPHLDNLWVYDLSAYDADTQTLIDLMSHLGDRQSHNNRPIASTTYKIPVSLEPDKTLKLLIFVHSTSSIQLPIYLWHPDNLLEQTQDLSLVYGIYFGITVVMALYNLFLGFSIRDISYFYYVGSIVLFALLQATLWGYSFQYFWPDQITFNEKSIPLLTFSVIVVDALFSRAFLQTAKNHRILDRVLLAIAFMNTVAFLAAWQFLPYQLAINIAIWSALLLCTVLLYTGIKLWRKGVIQARFYVLAWAVLLIGSVIYGFSIKGVLPINSITLHAAQLGSALEVIFLSFALADRINRMRLEKQEVERSTKLAMEEKNRDLNQILEALRKSNTVKDQFLATISHELRTPMHGIQSALELLTADRPESQDQTHLTAARSCAGHMTQMVESLLEFSEVQSGTLQLRQEPFNLHQALNPILEKIEADCRRKNITFQHLPARLNQHLIGDEKRLGEVLLQILDNAVKFTHTGSVTFAWEINVADSVIETKFVISDTGVGIDPKIKAHIFKPFNQGDSSFSRQYGGLGFGMSLSKALVETMGGTIHYDSVTRQNSDIDNGTQITIQIPWQKGTEIIASHDNRALKPTEGVDSTDSQTETALPVLIVEDNPVNQLLLKTIVIKLGYPVETANNGGEAIEMCNKLSFCCILMDCQMPIIDGFEATRTIRAHSGKNNRTPIIAVTANAMSGDRERCLASGMSDYLKKPVSKSQLKRCIEANLCPETDT